MVGLTLLGIRNTNEGTHEGMMGKVDPPTMNMATPPLTPDDHSYGNVPPNHVMVLRRRLEEMEDEDCIPGSSDSLVSELTFQQSPDPQQHHQIDPPGTTLRVYNPKPDFDAAIPVRNFGDMNNRNDVVSGKFDPPAKNQLSGVSMGESIVTRVLGIVDLSCVSPFSSDDNESKPKQFLTPESLGLTSERPQWGIPPAATIIDEGEDNINEIHGVVDSFPSSSDLDSGIKESNVNVSVAPDTEEQQAYLQLNLPVVSPERKSAQLSSPVRTSGWLQKTLVHTAKVISTASHKKQSAKDHEAKPNQKVETILGVIPRYGDSDLQSPSSGTPPPPITKSSPTSTSEDDSFEETKDTNDKREIAGNFQPLSGSSVRARSPSSESKKKITRNILKPNRTPKLTKSNSSSPKMFRKKEKTLASDDSSVLKKLKGGGKLLRMALHPMNKKDNCDSRTAETASSSEQQNPTAEHGENQTHPPKVTNSSGRSSPSLNLFKALTATPENLDSSGEANNKEETVTRVVTNYDEDKFRLRKVLKSIKDQNKGQLETVLEAPEEEAMSYSTGISSEHMLVRVPGIHRGAPDAYISDKDLIGDEYVEEEDEEEIVLGAPTLRRFGSGNNEGNIIKPTEKNLSILGLVTDNEINTKHSQTVSKTPNVKVNAVVEHKTPFVESRDRLAPWKDFLGIKNESYPIQDAKKKAVENNTRQSEGGQTLTRHQSAPDSPGKEIFLPRKSTSEVNSSPPAHSKPMWKAVIDPASGKTYYYHRKTRETTWSKPPDKDIVPVKIMDGTQLIPTKYPMSATATPSNPAKVELFTRKGTSGNVDPVALEKNQEIARMLAKVSHPANSTSIKRLVTQFEGREDELLTKLRDLSESKPFDEPIGAGGAAPDDERLADDATRLFARGRSGTDATIALSHAVASIHSGYSGHLSSGTRISEKTQLIRNTASSKPGFAPIQEDTKKSTAVSIAPQNALSPIRRRYPARNNAPIPKNIPVPRSRELTVEEFTTRDPVFGVKESDIQERKVRGLMNRQRKASPVESAHQDNTTHNSLDPSAYHGDIDETDNDKDIESTGQNDSVSALSEADLSFVHRQETLETTRRRALNEALAQNDWDRAADICELMRMDYLRKGPKNNTNVAGLGPNWKGSSLDRLIALNDWDGVATYVAQLRAKEMKAQRERMHQAQASDGKRRHDDGRVAGSKSQITSRGTAGHAASPASMRLPQVESKHKNSTAARHRVGARSQLQHIQKSDENYSSDSTNSSYTSEDYTSGSYYSEEEQPIRKQRKPPANKAGKEFAC